jgi:hypothetical protein
MVKVAIERAEAMISKLKMLDKDLRMLIAVNLIADPRARTGLAKAGAPGRPGARA